MRLCNSPDIFQAATFDYSEDKDSDQGRKGTNFFKRTYIKTLVIKSLRGYLQEIHFN